MSGLEASEAEATLRTMVPQTALADIEGAIAQRFDLGPEHLFTALGAWSTSNGRDGSPPTHEVVQALKCFSICLLVMSNGFVVIGKSYPASPENFDADFGRELAYWDCIRQLWPLMSFSLRDRLAAL